SKCLTQLADQALAAQGIEMQIPDGGGLSLQSPGFAFNPAMISDDPDDAYGLMNAVSANWGSFNVNPGLRNFQIQELCSFCITMPDF
ncbi:MAG TPA: hypothetical protein DCM40_45950, partial [Maribacter sp.]|nr:hypothetical protein [Maribacter sp.]